MLSLYFIISMTFYLLIYLIFSFVCKVCGDSFLRNQQFNEHEKSHLEKKPDDKDTPVVTKEKDNKYKCKTCQSSFTNWKLFYKHQQDSGHVNEKFLCEICGSEFLSNLLLSQHIRRLHRRTGEFVYGACSVLWTRHEIQIFNPGILFKSIDLNFNPQIKN